MSIPTGEALRAMLRNRYGAHWLSASAADIGVSTRTIKAWIAGEYEPTVRNRGKIKRAVVRWNDLAAGYAEECGAGDVSR
jgi:hypothetical protein